jgi:outer membrane protein assembly factor BamB
MPARTRAAWPVLALACAFAAGCSGRPSGSIDLPGDRVFPENISSTRDGTLYVGSLGAGGVYRIRQGAAGRQGAVAELWIKPGAFGSNAVFGVLADERTNTLWICSNDMSPHGVVIAGGDSGSVLKGFDLATGAGKVSAKLPGEHTLCNDIAIGADGSAFVTNTNAPQILRLAPGGGGLEVWFTDAALQPAKGAGLDGIAFGSDGNLYVDTYSPAALYRIDVKDGKPGTLTRLTTSKPLIKADALRALGDNRFLLIEGDGRLYRVTIQGDRAQFDTLLKGLALPTGVATVGQTAWVSEGQLNYLFDASKKDQTPRLPFRIYSVSLPDN